MMSTSCKALIFPRWDNHEVSTHQNSIHQKRISYGGVKVLRLFLEEAMVVCDLTTSGNLFPLPGAAAAKHVCRYGY